MKNRTTEPDFGATGQFEMTGVFQADHSTQEADFSHTLGMENVKSMVLVGAGLAHREVLAQLARHKRKDIDTVLVAPDTAFVHPHLLISWVAGDVSLDKCCIDLRPWIVKGGVRWIPASCASIDPYRQQVELRNLPFTTPAPTISNKEEASIPYDVLSLDDEHLRELHRFEQLWPGTRKYALVPHPSANFIHAWNDRVEVLLKQPPNIVQQVCVLGAHRHAVEWAFAVQQGLQKAGITIQVSLITNGEHPGHDLPPALQKRATQLLTQRGIKVREDRCIKINADTLLLERGDELPCDLALICHPLLGHHAILGSPVLHDPLGRVYVNAKLQSLSHPQIFAVGNLSCLENDPKIMSTWDHENIPEILSLNLMAYLSEQPLSNGQYRSSKPVTLNCSDQTAMVQWGPICTESHLAWKMYQKQQQTLLFQHQC